MSNFLLPVLYLRQFAEQLRIMDKSPVTWLQSCGLNGQQLDEPNFQPDYTLFNRLIQSALTLSNEPALGLLVGEQLHINTHGILGFAALQSASLRQTIQLLERYLALRTTLVSLRHIHDAEKRQEHLQLIPCYPLGAIECSVLEAVLLAIKNVLSAIAQGSIPLQQVSFPAPTPDYAPLAQTLFACPVLYVQPWAGLTFASDWLDQPLRMADPEAFREAELICQRELNKLNQVTSLSTRIRRLMLEKYYNAPSLEVTARLFHLTPRTLHRRLTDEGTSFKQIYEEVRHDLAIEHLKAGRLSVKEIAYALGYNDVANFRRAFKRWQGVPPSSLRARNQP